MAKRRLKLNHVKGYLGIDIVAVENDVQPIKMPVSFANVSISLTYK